MKSISVVMPLYNKEKTVQRAVESVLQQTYQDFELIVVDDGSTDAGKQIVESFTDVRIRILSQPNRGVSSARNTGIREASGSLIAFIDADDEWLPGFLAHIKRMGQEYPDAGLLATAYEIRLAHGLRYFPRFIDDADRYLSGRPIQYFYVAVRSEYGPVCSSAVCIPKRVFFEIGGFAVGQRLGEDLDMWGRIAMQYPVIWSSNVGAVYWQDDPGSTSRAIIPQDELPFVQTARTRLAIGPAMRGAMEDDLKEYISFLQIALAKQCVSAGHTGLAIRVLLNSDTTSLLWRSKLWWLLLALLPRRVFQFGRMIKRQFAANVQARRSWEVV